MRSSTCSAHKHLTFIPYALANVVEDEGDFTVAEGHGHPLRPSVCDGARVRHRKTTGPGPELPDSRISADRARCGGARPGPSQKARWLSGPLHGWNGHGRSLVPQPGTVTKLGVQADWARPGKNEIRMNLLI